MEKRSGQSGAWWGVWGLLVLSSTGCGGKSQVDGGDPQPSAGASSGGASNVAGAGNLAGASHAGSAGTASSTTCPVEPPTLGSACNYEGGDYCIYPIDKCSSASFECWMHVWVPLPPSFGAAYDCNSFTPPNAPHDGDSCACLENLDCSYSDCADRGQIHARCDNTTWHVTQTACEDSPCGPDGLSCEPGTVCVIHVGLAPQFECAPTPCPVTPTTCDCAATLCGPGEQCQMDSGAVACVCPTC